MELELEPVAGLHDRDLGRCLLRDFGSPRLGILFNHIEGVIVNYLIVGLFALDVHTILLLLFYYGRRREV